jgi:hypothetical protein
VTSTSSVIHQWKGLVKPELWAPLPEISHHYLDSATRSTEILEPKQAYRVQTGAKYAVHYRPLVMTHDHFSRHRPRPHYLRYRRRLRWYTPLSPPPQ